jgi:hypothetical protein
MHNGTIDQFADAKVRAIIVAVLWLGGAILKQGADLMVDVADAAVPAE